MSFDEIDNPDKGDIDVALLILRLLHETPTRLLRIAKRSRSYMLQSSIYTFLRELKPFSYHHLETAPTSKLCDNLVIVEGNNGDGVYVNTIIDGIIETVNVLTQGDWLFCGPKSEVYVLQSSKVAQLYNISDTCGLLTSKRVVRQAVELRAEDMPDSSGGYSLRFKAPWGADTVAEPGDYLVFERDICSGNIALEDLLGNVYRIAASAFMDTYDIITE